MVSSMMALTSALVVATLAVVAKYALEMAVTSSATHVFVTSFVSLYVVYKLYQLFMYPHYFSPLTSIPGPKVRSIPCPMWAPWSTD